MKKQILFIIVALFLVSLNLRMSIASVSPVLESIKHDLALTNGMVSLLTSIPVICMGFFAFFATSISTRFGLEKTIAYCLLLIGLATAFRAFTNSVLALLLTAFLIGIGIAIAGPLISGYIKKKFPNRIGMMIGVYSVGMGIGASLSAGLMIPLQKQLNDSWQLALASWSIFAVIGLLCWYPMLKKSEFVKHSTTKKIPFPFKNKKAWLFTLIFGLQAGIFYCISTWLAPIAQSMGFSGEQSGTIITLFTIIQMIFSFSIPSLADVYKNEKAWLMGSTLFVLLGLFCIVFDLANPWLATILIGIGLGGLFPLALALPLNAVSSSSEASSWTSMMQGVGYMIGGIIPIIAGLLRDYIAYDKQVFVLMMVLCLVLLISLLGWKNKKVTPYY
ncbi:CynX/NimT family MFS transporter [Peribacillus loiseleuriae]|uniref:MFS transporter n=1 Tax=Peribacillus loiseleuriae TaxID=1679170 RepID=A0A0K9GXC6_9BACI|nr:MFS transporter [Peribacillus loiseleuriae]KMY50912.1 MFS transporter [Peribacillus loiseleuriae]